MMKKILQICSVIVVVTPGGVQAMDPRVESMGLFPQKKLCMTSEKLLKEVDSHKFWSQYSDLDTLEVELSELHRSNIQSVGGLLKKLTCLKRLRSLTIIFKQEPDYNSFAALIPLTSLKNLEVTFNDKAALESNAGIVVISRFLTTLETLSLNNKAHTKFSRTFSPASHPQLAEAYP